MDTTLVVPVPSLDKGGGTLIISVATQPTCRYVSSLGSSVEHKFLDIRFLSFSGIVAALWVRSQMLLSSLVMTMMTMTITMIVTTIMTVIITTIMTVMLRTTTTMMTMMMMMTTTT